MVSKKWERYLMITLLGILVLTLAAGMTLAVVYQLMADRAAAGVQFMGQDMGGKTREEVVQALELHDRIYARQVFRLQAWDEIRSFSPAEVGVSLDVPALTEEVMVRGNRGNLLERLVERYRLNNQGGERLGLVVRHDEERMNAYLNSIARKVNQDRVPARFEVTGGQVEIIPSIIGLELDAERSTRNLVHALADPDSVEIPLYVVATEPNYTTEQLEAMGIDRLRASYSTRFYAGAASRNNNIRLAAGALRGQILEPGDVLSFNEIVGPRSSEAGYSYAPVIVDGELEPGLGGGVCQVSSTLYNTGLRGNLEIIERAGHSRPVSYVPPGRDATVAYDYIDLKMRNSSSQAFLLWTSVGRSNITIQLYGPEA